MPGAVKPIPEGFHSITPNLICRNAAQAIEFYKDVFGAKEVSRSAGPGGLIVHADLLIGDSHVFVNDPMGQTQSAAPAPPTVVLYLYCDNVDSVFDRAVKAGALVNMPVQDMFWGDRYGKITDPYGYQWDIATRKENIAREEMDRRAREFFARAAGGD